MLCVCVVDDAGVDEVLRGPHGALVDHGRRLHRRRAQHRAPRHLPPAPGRLPALHVVDAPVSGGGHKAAAGELLVMVGGTTPTSSTRCRPILETLRRPGPPRRSARRRPGGQAPEQHGVHRAAGARRRGLRARRSSAARPGRQSPTILASGSGRSYAADVVAGAASTSTASAAVAGTLLAKDVGILADAHRPDRFDAPRRCRRSTRTHGRPADPRRGRTMSSTTCTAP